MAGFWGKDKNDKDGQGGAVSADYRHALMRDAQGRASGPLGVALDVLAATNSFLPKGGRP